MTDFVLRYRRPDETWKEIQLKGDVTIGRSTASDIVLSDPGVAEHHAVISIQPDGIYVTDLGSAEGTKLEGTQLPVKGQQKIQTSQTLFIGLHTITLIEIKPLALPAELPPPPQGSQSLPDKLASSNEFTAWIMSHALLVGGIALAITAMIIIGVIIVLGSRQSETALINRTATALATQVQKETPALPDKTPGTEPGGPTAAYVPAAKPTAPQNAGEIEIRPPGAGVIEIDPINLLSNGTSLNNLLNVITAIASGKPLDLQTQITGENIGFVFTYIGYNQNMPDAATTLITVERKYITAEKVKEIEGIQYPDWGTGTIPIKYAWQPTLYYLSDGKNSEIALVYPVDYRSSYDKDASYAVDGIYAFSQSGEERNAHIYFDSNGKMRNIVGYKSVGDFKGAPFDIVPDTGDKFTILLEKFEFDEAQPGEDNKPAVTLPTGLPGGIENLMPVQGGKMPYGKGKFVTFKGSTLTYDGQPFSWKAQQAPPGDYVAGLVAEDMDGNFYAAYAPVKIK